MSFFKSTVIIVILLFLSKLSFSQNYENYNFDPNYIKYYDSTLIGKKMTLIIRKKHAPEYKRTGAYGNTTTHSGGGPIRYDFVRFSDGKFCLGGNKYVLKPLFNKYPDARGEFKTYMSLRWTPIFGYLIFFGTGLAGANVDYDVHPKLKIALLTTCVTSLVISISSNASAPKHLKRAVINYNAHLGYIEE